MEMKADPLGLKGSRLLCVETFVDLCKTLPCQTGFPTVMLRIGMTPLDHSVRSG